MTDRTITRRHALIGLASAAPIVVVGTATTASAGNDAELLALEREWRELYRRHRELEAIRARAEEAAIKSIRPGSPYDNLHELNARIMANGWTPAIEAENRENARCLDAVEDRAMAMTAGTLAGIAAKLRMYVSNTTDEPFRDVPADDLDQAEKWFLSLYRDLERLAGGPAHV